MKGALKQELSIHHSLNHKNIVKYTSFNLFRFVDVIETSNNFYVVQ
jgi:hypothetical protein